MMLKRYLLLASSLWLISGASDYCASVAKGDRFLKFSISRAKNASGEWVTSASATFDSGITERGLAIDIRQNTKDCGNGRYLVHFQGDFSEVADVQSLAFHPRHGSNIGLSENRKTAYRINDNIDHGVVYTDRPLKRQEMLTVSLDKTAPRHPFNLGIGVTTHTPFERDTPDSNIDRVSNMWLYYHIHIHINGSLVLTNYGKDLDNDAIFKVGDQVGVRVSHSGILHFFVNGVDQGPVADNIPQQVYGVLELRSKTVQVSIVDKP